MSEENKTVELTEAELDQVFGGASGDTRYKYWRCSNCSRTYKTTGTSGFFENCSSCGGTAYGSDSPWPGQSW